MENGPYHLDYTRNGKYLLLAGEKGHISIMDWKDKSLLSEFSVKERVRDACWLHNETLLAIAQKKRVYIYDNSGLEIHCLQKHLHPNALDFLPYHFLLVTLDGKRGILRYHDTSMGQIVAEHKTWANSATVMRQNPYNAVMCVGHSNGQVTMWTPNLSTPVVKIQCHPSAVRGLAVDPSGRYMCTSSLDCRMKVWDLRKYAVVHEFFTPGSTPATSLDISQRGLLGLVCGDTVQVWKGWEKTDNKPKAPYMKHTLSARASGCEIQFAPFEDFMGIGHSNGFSSIVVPGSGESNVDSFEANPYESKKQKRELIVRGLLEKLPANMITLEVDKIGSVDPASKEVKAKEKLEEMKEYEQSAWKKKKRKMKEEAERPEKKDKDYVKIKQKIRAKNKDIARKLYETKLKEHDGVEKDLEFLSQIEGKFDPVNALLSKNENKVAKSDN